MLVLCFDLFPKSLAQTRSFKGAAQSLIQDARAGHLRPAHHCDAVCSSDRRGPAAAWQLKLSCQSVVVSVNYDVASILTSPLTFSACHLNPFFTVETCRHPFILCLPCPAGIVCLYYA